MSNPFPFIGPGIRGHGRLVDAPAGGMTYLLACGHTPCDASRFPARFVKTDLFGDTYLMVSECRRANDTSLKPQYTPLAGYPDPGIPTVIRCTAGPSSFSPCFPDQCNDFDLVWDGSQYGGASIATASGSIPITVTPVFVAGNFSSWHFNWKGSCAPGGADKFINCSVECFYPMIAGGAAPLGGISGPCCGGAVDPNTSYFVNIFGVTPRRYVGREVGTEPDGTPKFEVAECCAPSICSTGVTCCGCDAVPTNWQFECSGVTAGVGCLGSCLGFNRVWTLVYGFPHGVSPCTWGVPSTENPGICTPGTPWQLFCDGVNYTLIATDNAGNNTFYQVPVSGWKCFGPNYMPKVSQGTGCLTFPDRLLLLAS